MRERFVFVVRYWIPIAVAVSALCFLVYLVEQQSLRMSLNDPQLQLAQDVAARLVDGAEPKQVMSAKATDIAASLSAWVMLYDESGKPVFGGAQLEGTATAPPKGVFEYTRANGEDRITWQPREDVRIATVVEYWRNAKASGFVVSGRNMREIEGRIDRFGRIVLGAWLSTLLATLLAALLFVPEVPSAPRAPFAE